MIVEIKATQGFGLRIYDHEKMHFRLRKIRIEGF